MIALPGVLTGEELKLVREFLDHAEFEDGKLTAKGAAAERKQNLQAARSKDAEGLNALDQVVVAALGRHAVFQAWAWPRRVTAPLYARYEPGMHYGPHVDSSLMGVEPPLRTDVSLTVFLNDPGEYDGGELAVDLGGGAVSRVKLPAGTAFAYPTTALHQVMPVTRGLRLVAVLWAQSYARDPRVREAVFDLRSVLQSVHSSKPTSVEAQLLQKTLSNLERLFAET